MSDSALVIDENVDLDHIFSDEEENEPKSSSFAPSTSRMPLAPLQQSAARIVPSRPTTTHQPKIQQALQHQRQLLSAMPRLSMAVAQEEQPSSSSHHPPAAKRLRLRHSWSYFREFIRTPTSQALADAGRSQTMSRAPLPCLRWAERQEMWELMCKKETGMYRRTLGDDLMARHPQLQPRMRAILFDWLMEVCEVYRLHRETFWLAVDFIDRYLSITRDTPKSRLQLIGECI